MCGGDFATKNECFIVAFDNKLKERARKMRKIEEIHEILFDILVAIDELCEKHGITYYLDSGTLLGAVREKDFIPWDDDADITMKREDYERFLSVSDELPEKYKLVTPDKYGGYFFDFTPRVLDMSAPLREETSADIAQNNHQNRVAVDIFIIDRAPDDKKEFSRMVFCQKMIYGNAMAHRYEKSREKHSFMQNMQVAVLRTMGRFMRLEKIFARQEKLSTSYRNENTSHYCVTNFPVRALGHHFEKEVFAEPLKMTLHGREFSCPSGYDEILTKYYGDYMTPPKKEDRVPIHIGEEK